MHRHHVGLRISPMVDNQMEQEIESKLDALGP